MHFRHRPDSEVGSSYPGRTGFMLSRCQQRAGFITAAAEKNVPEIDIARVSGHVSAEVLRGYVRRAKVLDAAPLTAIVK